MTGPPAGASAVTVHALVISPEGEWKVAQISSDLGTYQRIIGDVVTIYYPHRDWHVYCHEATSFQGVVDVPGNRLATDLAQWVDPSWTRLIRGVAVIVGTGPKGKDLHVPAEVLRHVRGEL